MASNTWLMPQVDANLMTLYVIKGIVESAHGSTQMIRKMYNRFLVVYLGHYCEASFMIESQSSLSSHL